MGREYHIHSAHPEKIARVISAVIREARLKPGESILAALKRPPSGE
jgi:hypothetical protein